MTTRSKDAIVLLVLGALVVPFAVLHWTDPALREALNARILGWPSWLQLLLGIGGISMVGYFAAKAAQDGWQDGWRWERHAVYLVAQLTLGAVIAVLWGGALGHTLTKPVPLWAVLLLLGVLAWMMRSTDKWTANASAVLQEHAARLTAIDHREFGEMTDLAYREARMVAATVSPKLDDPR